MIFFSKNDRIDLFINLTLKFKKGEGLMTEILFIRHGETDCNKKRLYYGHLNPGLNENGLWQLKNTKINLEKMKENKNIDIVFSSDLKRCSQSMEILGIDKKVEKIFTEELRELNFGIFEGKTYEEIKNEYNLNDIFKARKSNSFNVIENNNLPIEVKENNFFKKLIAYIKNLFRKKEG